MSKIFLSFICVLLATFSYAQVLQDRISGKYYINRKATDVKGHPFLFDEWMRSLLTYNDGLQLMNVRVKFDIEKNIPLFLRNDSSFEFIKPVEEFILYDSREDSLVFRNGFPEADGNPTIHYYQVLADGKLTLLKLISKKLVEIKEFNNASKLLEYMSISPVYYLFNAGKMKKLKKEDVLKESMEDKWDLVKGYMKSNDLNFKKEKDLILTVKYYNSL